MSERAAVLQRFLLETGDLPFVYGERDCALWVCDWIVACGHADPAAPFRGAYHDEQGCTRLLEREGGLLVLATKAFEGCGLVRAEDHPRPGDVACLDTLAGEALAIAALGDRFAWKSNNGLVSTAVYPVLRAWRV